MKIIFRLLSALLLVTFLSLFEFIGFVYALPIDPIQKPGSFLLEKTLQHKTISPPFGLTNLTMEPLKPLELGVRPIITVVLTNEVGKPIANQPIIIFIDGKHKASGKTDSNGRAVIPLKYKFAAGEYHIKALYAGIPSLGLPAVSAERSLIIQSSKVAIRTIPAMAGINFKFNGVIYTSDKNGVVNIQSDKPGWYSLEVLQVDDKLLPPNVTMEFSRWNDNVFTPNRQIYFPRNRPLEVGFVSQYLVNVVFFDLTGNLVDPARVSSMTLKGFGQTFTFDQVSQDQKVWLPADRLNRRIGERLESQDITYYFRDVNIDGVNVINQSQQRFNIRPGDTWFINVLLYSVRFSARDAMFHFPLGRGIALTYPDGHIKEFLFDSDQAELEINALARGSYTARIIGAGGSALPTPVHLSRDQDIEMLAISYLDMAIIVGLPILFALLLFFLGRPRIFFALRHPSRFRELLHT